MILHCGAGYVCGFFYVTTVFPIVNKLRLHGILKIFFFLFLRILMNGHHKFSREKSTMTFFSLVLIAKIFLVKHPYTLADSSSIRALV